MPVTATLAGQIWKQTEHLFPLAYSISKGQRQGHITHVYLLCANNKLQCAIRVTHFSVKF